MMPRTRETCFLGCETNEGNLHQFPDPSSDKFMEWKKALHPLLDNMPFSYIHRNIRLCDKHFNNCFHTNGGRLTINAAPDTKIEMMEEYLDDSILDALDNVVEVPTLHSEKKDASHYEVPIYKTYSPTKPSKQPIKEAPLKAKGLHEGFRCNICNKDIYGFRYVCVQCADWDMCAACETKGEHSQHYMLRIPAPRPYAEIQYTLDLIRREFSEMTKKSSTQNAVRPDPRGLLSRNTIKPTASVQSNTMTVKPLMVKKDIKDSNPLKIAATKPIVGNKINVVTDRKGPDSKLFLEVTPIQAKPDIKRSTPTSTNQTDIKKQTPNKTTTVTTKSSPVKGDPLDSVSVRSTAALERNALMRTYSRVENDAMRNIGNTVRKKEDVVSGNFKKKPQQVKLVLPPGINTRKLMHSLTNAPKVKVRRLTEKVISEYSSKS